MQASRLPLNVRTRADEPAHACLFRLAQRYGAREPTLFARSIGFSVDDLRAGKDVDRFAHEAGVDAALLGANSPQVEARLRRVRLRDNDLLLGDWSVRSRRWCPLCLRADAAKAAAIGIPKEWWQTGRAWWNIRSVSACIDHKRSLIETCWRCAKVQTWRGCWSACACGADLLQDSNRLSEVGAAEYILGRLTFAAPQDIPVLDELPLYEAIRVTELLGAARIIGRSIKPRRSAAERQDDRDSGIQVARGWPVSIVSILDQWTANRRANSAAGLIEAYGWIYSDLANGNLPAGFSARLSPVLRNHAISSGIMARDEERLVESAPATYSATEVARLFGTSYKTARRRLEEAEIIPDGSRRGVRFALDPTAVEDLAPAPRWSASKLLGVGRTQSRNIMKLVSPAKGRPALRESDVREWLRKLRRRSEAKLEGELIPLPVACRNMSVPLIVACQSLSSGALMAKSSGADLSRMLVRQADLAKLRNSRSTMNIQEISRAHNIHPEAVLSLVRSGAFGKLAVNEGPQRSKVTEFFLRHISASELARKTGTSPRALAQQLERLGVRPLYAPPTCRQIIFARADLLGH